MVILEPDELLRSQLLLDVLQHVWYKVDVERSLRSVASVMDCEYAGLEVAHISNKTHC